ncbi:hypothetical protein WN55_09338 [Dufourea novaeangliae]|uniref:Mucin-19-like n=1 Tax=Dufourea novaeangliae TaxID=178035 RepID=A0A154PAN2_DUFNO|nr:hypothetical protein WN55_09338 [Dufourea novaeangliae]
MRLILIYLIFSSGTVFSRYSEKRHFDRSVYDDTKLLIRDKYLPKKQWIFSDYDTNFKAYKDKEDNICYLEKMDDSTAVEDLSAYGRQEQISKIFYASTDTLTKLEAWRIAGGRIIAFCHGRKLILLQNTMPVFGETTNPFLNVIPQDENDIAVRRVADVVLTPLISRTKRQIILEERERLIENSSRTRTRRQAQQPRGRFRGQTQSQYLSIDSEDQKEGKAEAEATQQSSRAVVSGSRGMGQAQSMSVGNNGCEECPKYTNEGAPDRYVQYPSAGSFIQPGVITPGNNADTTFTRGPLPRGPAYPDNITPTGDTTPGNIVRGGADYPGGVPSIMPTGGRVTYPTGTIGTTTKESGVSYPGSLPGTTTGGGVVYPGSVPGITSGGAVTYPGGVPGSTAGGGVSYPGGIPGPTAGGEISYPGGVPGPTAGGGVSYPGGVPGSTAGGGVTYPSGVPRTTSGAGSDYPAGIPGRTDSGTYPGGIPGTRITEGGVSYPSGAPGTVMTGPGISYPAGVPGRTDSGVTYAGGIPGTRITEGGVSYPSGAPSTVMTGPGVTYPGSVPGTRISDGQVSYPLGVPSARITGGGVSYPSGVPGTRITEGGVSYPSGVPGTRITEDTRGQIITESKATADTKIYPGQISGFPYPGVIVPGQSPSDTGGRTITTNAEVPSGYSVQEQHPGVATWHDGQGQTISDMTGRHVNGGSNRQGEYLSEGQNIRQQYPTGMRPANAGEISQYYQQAASAPTVEDDNSNSQASSSVKQTDSGTQASASSQGTYGEGTAQSQVTGTYSGSGSFSAQAGSSDTNKNAQTEISGGKEGATSNAQGAGGYGKSQAQVQLDSESGATSTGAQSNGWNHGTNSQVQASSRGGMADAQANGEGSTSSQAQIGFQPYLKTDEKLERHAKPFRGGGTASAQSGMHRGQSQSQLEGSFQYGITYTGAAQAGSGSGAAASRKPFKFNLTETELFKPFEPYNTPQITKSNGSSVTNTSSGADYEYNQEKPPQGLQSSSSSRRTVIANATKEVSQNVAGKQTQSGEKSQVDDTMYDYDEEYGDYDASQTQTSTDAKYSKNYIADQNNSDHQSQMIQVTTGNQYDVHVHQDSNTPQLGDRLQPGQSLPGYTIPPGFRGRVKSVAGDETTAHGDGKSQSQTVSLIPRIPNTAHETKSPNSETRSLKTNHERLAEDHALSKEEYNFSRFRNHQTSTDYSKPATVPMKPSYYTVTNSFAGKMDGSKNSHKKYEHRYYTKSSTCGYFTFSCNVVYGSNGRTKICKPKMPTHPDGTPVKC